MINRLVAILSILLLTPAVLRAQTFDAWVEGRISAILGKQQASDQVGQNGKGVDRQRESPATDPRSTSLVDQSSATDFFSAAMNVVPVTPGLSQLVSPGNSSDPSSAGSGTVTSSLYALLAAANKKNPTDPVFYKSHVNARRLSLTVGTAASKKETDNTDQPSAVYGAKLLLINHRELYTKDNLAAIKAVQDALSNATAQGAVLKKKIQLAIFKALRPADVHFDGSADETAVQSFFLAAPFSDTNFPATLNSLPPNTLNQIDELIESSIAPQAALQQSLKNTYDKISKGMQFSIAYTANIRDAQGNNGHRAELIFDYGLSSRINWTLNASGDYTDRKTAADSKGGRIATEFQGNLTTSESAWGRTPLQLSFSGEGQWLTQQKPQYTFQTKLSIPLVSGIDLPIVYRYANRTALLNQKDSEARLGLSVDISRLAKVLK
jgi:hypothetical protein